MAVASALSETVHYAVLGGAACSILGSTRQTEDVDVVVPQNVTRHARAALRASSSVESRTNHTTYLFDHDTTSGGTQTEPIDIEILTPPSLFQDEYTSDTPVFDIGGVCVLHPMRILTSKCNSVVQRSSPQKRQTDIIDIKFLLNTIITHQMYQSPAELTRLRTLISEEWITYYVKAFDPASLGLWVGLGLYPVVT